MAEKKSAQINSANIVEGILLDSMGRVPDGNIELDINVDDNDIHGAKYDSSAETSTVKTAASFTLPAEGKYWDIDGTEQDFT